MRWYHGTTERSARSLLSGAPLSAERAAEAKTDGPPGFFLADERSDAEFFAVRGGEGAVIVVDIDDEALATLVSAGADRRPIPASGPFPRFEGTELWVATEGFELFNSLRREGRIRVTG